MKKFSYGYILSFISAVLILLQVLGIKIDAPYVNEVATAVLGVLAALGIVSGKDGSAKNGENADGVKESDEDVSDGGVIGGDTSEKGDID